METATSLLVKANSGRNKLRVSFFSTFCRTFIESRTVMSVMPYMAEVTVNSQYCLCPETVSKFEIHPSIIYTAYPLRVVRGLEQQ